MLYLKKHVGQVLDGRELMVVSGISEYARRIRELRVQFGWQIISGMTLRDMQADEGALCAVAAMELSPTALASPGRKSGSTIAVVK